MELRQFPSENRLEELFEQFEGFHEKVYLSDVGESVIGFGHLLTDDELSSGLINVDGETIDFRNKITREQAQKIQKSDIRPVQQAIDKFVKAPLTANQRDSLASFIWSIGIRNFEDSKLLKMINARKYEEVPNQMLRWTKREGKPTRGLEERGGN